MAWCGRDSGNDAVWGVCARSGLSSPLPGVVPGSRGKEKDPDGTFGPGAVPPATSSASVVYWAPGSFPKPNPRRAGAAWQPRHRTGQKNGWLQASPTPVRARSRRARILRPARPGLDRGQQLTACPIDVNPPERHQAGTLRTGHWPPGGGRSGPGHRPLRPGFAAELLRRPAGFSRARVKEFPWRS